MIKPFKVTNVREEPEGAKTVYFTVKKYVYKDNGGVQIDSMSTAIYVDADKDVDETIFEDLKKTGWI
jgi:hypothetical protein